VRRCIDPALKAKGLTHGVRGGQRQHRGSQQRRPHQPDAEQRLCPAAGHRCQSQRGLFGSLHADALHVERCRGRDDDERRYDVADGGAEHHIGAGTAKRAHGDALVHDGGLHVHRPPRSDRGAHRGQDCQDVVARGLNGGDQRLVQHLAPVRLDQERRDHVRHGVQGQPEQHSFYPLIGSVAHQPPDAHPGDGNHDVPGHAEQLGASRDARELRHGSAQVRQDQPQHDKEGRPQAKALADQVGQALAGGGAHARGHFLHDHLADGDPQDDPEKAVAVCRPGHRVRGDAGGVVVGGGRDKPRPQKTERH